MPSSLKTLINKNFKLELHTIMITIIEIIVIIVFYLIVAFDPINSNSHKKINKEDTKKALIFQEHSLDNIDILKKLLRDKGDSSMQPFSLAYTPDNSDNKMLVDAVVSKLNLDGAKAYEDQITMMDKFDSKKTLAAIIFNDENHVTLRFPAEFRTYKSNVYIFDNLWVSRCSNILNARDSYEHTDLYIREGFLQLQHQLVEQWLVLKGLENESLPEITMKSFRQFTTEEICQKIGTSDLLYFLYTFTFFITYLNFLWQYGREREKNILAHHWRYGISYGKYWAAHCIVSFFHLLVLDIIIIVLVKIPMGNNAGRFEGSFYLILAYLLLHNIALLLSVVALVSVWSVALHAVLFGAIYWISMYAMFSIVITNITSWGFLQIFTTLLFFNNSFEYGMNLLQNSESINESNYLMYPFIIMAVCCILAWIFISFAEYASPGQYIETKPFILFGIKLFNVMNKREKESKNMVTFNKKPVIWQNFEYGPVDGIELIRLSNVAIQSGDRQILKKISLRVFSNEIAVIHGPHCSGKTTIIKVLAGWKRPTNGTVELDGANFYENWDKFRHIIDVSMPNNQLFDYLTAEENLIYYITLKLPKKDDQKLSMELEKWFQILKSSKLKNKVLVKQLSFDQKRLLMLCCILAAGTKIILLDQPTLHMKGPNQRLYWDILIREKANRAIVLTTFDIRETEAVADRIALISDGTLLAYGTQFFIKSRFGIGCDLIILKQRSAPTQPMTDLIAKFIPKIMPDNEIGDQVTYKLPIDMRPKYQHMLIHLEKEKESLGIIDIRVLGTEVSEVFTTLGSKKNKQVIETEKRAFGYVEDKKLGRQQSYALFYKKLIHQAPNYIPLVTILVSFLLILLIAYLAKPLYLKSVRDNKIFLGDQYEILPERSVNQTKEGCPVLEIYNLKKTSDIRETESDVFLIFEKEKFKCVKKDYESYLKSSKDVSTNFGAVEQIDNKYVGWINENIFHSAPLTLNLMHNIFLEIFNHTNAKVINHPIPAPLHTKISLLDQLEANLVLPMVLGVVVPISIGSFITYLVEERKYHLLTLQKMAGVSMFRYWRINFIWDFLTFFSYTIVYVIVLACSQVEGFSFSDKMMIFLLMNIYGIPGLAMVYLISMFFHKTIWSAFLIAVLVQVTTGIFLFLIYWDVADTNAILFYLSSLFPAFAFMNGISNVYTKTKEELYCDNKCRPNPDCNRHNMCKIYPNCCFTFWEFFKFSEPGVMPSIAFMLLSSVILFCALIIIEKRRRAIHFSSKRDTKDLRTAAYSFDDVDVVNVKKLVAEHDYHTSLHIQLMVDQLEYSIPKTATTLDTISFEVEKGQCLGIYGTRHSGKSHVAGQLVGEVPFSFGDIYVDGNELKYNYKEACWSMSYVPQVKGYWKTFTPRELLRFFCLLRGIKPSDIRGVLSDLSLNFNMGRYMDKKISLLSVDRRRKVNIAVALIAQHQVIILDEPTRGLSPHASREIWNVLRYKRFLGKTIVFTTSDIIELEALSDYALVYSEGEMWAYGGTQYLRHRYTRGFYIDIKLKRNGVDVDEANENLRKDTENLHRFVTFLHEESELQIRYDNWFRFYCPVPHVLYSYLYGTMEKNKRRLNIADYIISQGSLDNAITAIYKLRQTKKDQ